MEVVCSSGVQRSHLFGILLSRTQRQLRVGLNQWPLFCCSDFVTRFLLNCYSRANSSLLKTISNIILTKSKDFRYNCLFLVLLACMLFYVAFRKHNTVSKSNFLLQEKSQRSNLLPPGQALFDPPVASITLLLNGDSFRVSLSCSFRGSSKNMLDV